VEEGTAASFDQVELRVDFVSAVNGYVDGGGSGVVEQGEAGFAGRSDDFR
jgi:hypothetical protein